MKRLTVEKCCFSLSGDPQRREKCTLEQPKNDPIAQCRREIIERLKQSTLPSMENSQEEVTAEQAFANAISEHLTRGKGRMLDENTMDISGWCLPGVSAKALLREYILIIQIDNKRLIINGVFSASDSLDRVYEKCEKTYRTFQAISSLIWWNKPKQTDCDYNRAEEQKLSWDEVVSWINTCPVE